MCGPIARSSMGTPSSSSTGHWKGYTVATQERAVPTWTLRLGSAPLSRTLRRAGWGFTTWTYLTSYPRPHRAKTCPSSSAIAWPSTGRCRCLPPKRQEQNQWKESSRAGSRFMTGSCCGPLQWRLMSWWLKMGREITVLFRQLSMWRLRGDRRAKDSWYMWREGFIGRT